MPISGVCHDFAFTRCFPVQSSTKTPSVSEHRELWRKLQTNMRRVDPAELDQLGAGVLTVVDPQGGVTYCPHSYYVADNGRLISTNDPFITHVGVGNVAIVNEYGVQATAYPATALVAALNNINNNSARIGTDQRNMSFYWCSSSVARLGWWS